MLLQRTILEALDRYAAHPDPNVALRLALFGPAVLAAADAAKTAATDSDGLPEADALARHLAADAEPLLRSGALRLNRASLLAAAQAVREAVLESLEADAELLEGLRNFDFAPFLTEERLAVASRDPLAWLTEVGEATQTVEGSYQDFILPILGLALRSQLDGYATKASRALERLDDPVTARDRRLHCPVCGAPATMAVVVPTPTTGNVKKLWCECCGASWKFERIRCAACGDAAVSDLEYVHDEKDAAHRLHVCKGCGAATPTYFATGDEETFSPDIESFVLTGLECAFEEAQPES